MSAQPKASNSIHRFCVLNDNSIGSLASVSLFFVDLGLRVEQQITKTWGNRGYGIFDVICPFNLKVQEIVQGIENLKAVQSCELGHFSYGLDKLDSERICVVHNNAQGVLAAVAAKVSASGFNILSQVCQNKGSFGYTILDLEKVALAELKNRRGNGLTYEKLAEEVGELEDVLSCDLRNFAPGSLHQLELLESRTYSKRSLTVALKRSTRKHKRKEKHKARRQREEEEKSDSEKEDSGYESEDEGEQRKESHFNKLSVKASTMNLSPLSLERKKPLAEPTNVNYYEGSQITQNVNIVVSPPMRERKNLTNINRKKLVIAMVGLPCRGKSFTSRKLEQFLNWKCIETKIFNAGKYRRDQKLMKGAAANLFSGKNSAGLAVREAAAEAAMDDMLQFLKRGGDVGIFDATNSVKSRRKKIIERCRGVASIVFVEVVCDDETLLKENYLIKIRNSPDYVGMTLDQALKDLKIRVKNYEDVYETIEETEDLSFVKLYNISSKTLTKGIYGRMARSVVPYLNSLHVGSRSVILVRAGLAKNVSNKRSSQTPTDAESVAPLSERGLEFARKLSMWLKTMLFMRREHADQTANALPEPSSPEPVTEKNKLQKLTFRNILKRMREHHRAIVDESCENKDMKMLPVFHSRPRVGSTEKVILDDGEVSRCADIKVMTSTLHRARETAAIALESLKGGNTVEPLPMLNPINRGKFAHLSNEELKKKHPEFWKEYTKKPFYARFPGGESYFDMVTKLEPVVIDIEQQTAPVM